MKFQDKLLSALRRGRELTVAQVRAIGFANPYAAINNLKVRKAVNVVAKRVTLKTGTRTTRYRLSLV